MAIAQFPLLCEVAVICVPDADSDADNPVTHMVSQVLPAEVPIVKFLDRLRDSVNGELNLRGFEQLPAGDYELRTIGGERLDERRHLRELGVHTGMPLVLIAAAPDAAYVPHYEQLSTGLARVGKKLVTPVTAEIAVYTALAILAMSVLVGIACGLRVRTFTDSPVVYLITGAIGAGLAAMAVATGRWWPKQVVVIDALAWMSCVTLTAFGYMFAPGPLGAPQLLLAGALSR